MILPLVEINFIGVPVAVIFLELNVSGTRQIFAEDKRAVRQKRIGRGAVSAAVEAVIKFFVNRIESRESHKRGEKGNRRVEFNDKSFRVGRTHA